MTRQIKYLSDGTSIDGPEPIVILGPNGSGKTRFGLQLAQWNNAETIAALRNIALEQNIQMQSLEQAEQQLTQHKNQRRQKPWSISSEINNLFAKLMAQDSASAIDFRERFQAGETRVETTNLMRLQKSWELLFPGRHISFRDYTPKVTSEYVAGETAYPAQSMSDGERVALYLAGRVLDAPAGIIVVDEPEVHFHSRLAIQFWDELEKLRTDCRFVYITHDLTFARSRPTDNYIIVRPGQDPELINVGEGIPSEIVENILSAASFSIYANRIIFCEGRESSYDPIFLRAWFNRRVDAVVPVGSCRDVVRCASTFRNSQVLGGVDAIGIVDRDYWPQVYLDGLPDGVKVLPAHEIESLLCRQGIFAAVAEHHGHGEAQIGEMYSAFLSEAAARFTGPLLNKQVSERFRARCDAHVNAALNSLDINGSVDEMRANHSAALAPANWDVAPEQLFDEERQRIESALVPPHETLLELLPGKVYFSLLVSKLGLERSAYIDIIQKALRAKETDNLAYLGAKIRADLVGVLPDG